MGLEPTYSSFADCALAPRATDSIVEKADKLKNLPAYLAQNLLNRLQHSNTNTPTTKISDQASNVISNASILFS